MKIPLIVISILIIASVSWAKVELPAVFSDGAVLQRDQDLPVWGWGSPGANVSVRFADQTKTTRVDADGKWMVTLSPVKGSYDTHTMQIQVGRDSLELTDLLVGEVWLCTGQSNMQYTFDALVGRSKDKGYQSIIDSMQQLKDTVKDPYLRKITVPAVASLEEGMHTFEGEWMSVEPKNNGSFSATTYFFARELRNYLDCPVGMLTCAWGGQRIDGFIPPSAWMASTEKANYEKEIATIKHQIATYDPVKAQETLEKEHAQWKANNGHRRKEPKLYNPSVITPNIRGVIYNGMIHPLAPYALRGMLWYQGESHSRSNPQSYGYLMELLITGLRAEWGQGDFPVYYCQLAGFMKPESEPLQETPSMVVICNQQRLSMKIPNTGMAVLNDVGQATDYHPKNKLDVGLRLSKWALNKTYGFEDIVPSGPLYQSYHNNGSSITITFEYAGSGLMTGNKPLLKPVVPSNDPISGFEICGDDHQWKAATA
ncbi:MAG TPA: 9-O-acetylesterase, partial [Opitutae bacterium]|nr:9-O-acetylesterase [Opitutae bacterium]